MLAPHNFSGSVALNYESYTRNWTVNFTRDKMYFFTTTSLQAVVYHPPHVEEVSESLSSCKIMQSGVGRDTKATDCPNHCMESVMTSNKWVELGAGFQVTSYQPKIDCSDNAVTML